MKSHVSLQYVAWLGGASLLATLHSKGTAGLYVTSVQGARSASMSEDTRDTHRIREASLMTGKRYTERIKRRRISSIFKLC